jgi:NAD(P)-dependent dehydrogenase (short-subunit alcohol dehydrogenase family)
MAEVAEIFGATSTADDVLSRLNLRGKRMLITGVSAGLGIETARSLAAHGAQVVGTARDLSKAEAATAQVRKDAGTNDGSFDLLSLDLANLKSVRACADGLVERGYPFDVIIANAGVMATPFARTADGFETQFGTNHLGHFLLVNRIAHLIRSGGRVDVLNQRSRAAGKGPFQWKSIPQGAATAVWAAVVVPAAEVGGRYCEDCHVAAVLPDTVPTSATIEGVRSYALDAKNAEALWKKSEEMVGEKF